MPLEQRIESSGREAQRSLTRRLLQECDEALSEMESLKTANLTSETCFRLFYRVGFLEFNDWRLLLPSELAEVNLSIDSLESRLGTLLTMKEKKEQLVTCLESGILQRLDKMLSDYLRVTSLLAQGRLDTTLPSIELNAILLSWRDNLGYAFLLFKKIGLKLSAGVVGRLDSLDIDLKRLLPKIIAQYRKVDDDPTPYPDHFPESFWWRHL